MTFTKTTAARQIDAYRSFAAQVKFASITSQNGQVVVTEMQTGANALDCRWFAASEAEAVKALTEAGYERAVA